MSFLGLTIRNRLYFGFGIIVLLGLALSAYSGWQLSQVQTDVTTMAGVSDAAVRAREIAEQIQTIRRALLQYAIDGDQTAFKESADKESKAIELLQAAIVAAAGREDRLAVYRGLQKSILELRAKREALGAAVASRSAGRDALFSGGDQLTAATQKLLQAARENDNHAIVQGAATLETAVLLTRIANWRFLATLDPKGVTTFNANVEKARQHISVMEKADLPQDIGALLASVDAALTNYANAFEQTSTNLLKADDIYNKEVKPLTIATRETINSLTLAQGRELQEEQAQGQNMIASTLTMQEVITALSILLGGLIAFFIARGISGPLKTMGGVMKELAAGNHNVEIPAQDNKDEIGEMAKAVLVFREAAIENARLQHEAAEHATQAEGARAHNEQAQQAAIERERKTVVDSIGAGLAKLAAKDLTYRMSSDIPEAYRQLQTNFNAAIAQLEEAMLGVTGSTDAIQSGTQEISSASDDLSRRTEQQAASLEETAAALDEITATVKKSAEGASHARQVVAAADGDAKKSALVVRQAVEAMDAIAKSAQQISQIIGVIDEIAFQTNLLALNAGVEAARAGDAGRGFAVVASEVRALAQRSAEAAKEIKGLISASTTQVDHGVKLVAETGKSLERIMAQVTEINDVVSDIAAGAKEQATGLDEVNSAINQMDQVTQQNAAMVEESTAASHSLSQETSQLSGLIGQFQVGRASSADPLRRELQKVAPHAFRQQPAKAPPAHAPRPEARKAPSARPMRAAPKAVANGASAAESAGWEEF